jgi:hypothetical protein
MNDDEWLCPAIEKAIPNGLCWEYCFADICGPMDTTTELRMWIIKSGKFKNIEDFHKVCEKCPHC